MAKRARSCERGCASTIMTGSGAGGLTGFCVGSASTRPVSSTRQRTAGCFSELPNKEIACPGDDSRLANGYGSTDVIERCHRRERMHEDVQLARRPQGYVD